MAEVQTQLAALSIGSNPRDSQADAEASNASKPRNRLAVETYSPVNQNGSFEFDRVIKSGYVQKRTQKTKVGSPLPRGSAKTASMESRLFPNSKT